MELRGPADEEVAARVHEVHDGQVGEVQPVELWCLCVVCLY
jgi:hypothetical protein